MNRPFHWLALLPILVLLAPAICASAENCPWLNAETAGGVLGGSVSATVEHHRRSADDAACTFSRELGQLQYALQIDVQTMTTPKVQFAAFKSQCGAHAEQVRAIGNEAVACSYTVDERHVSEQVIGRVREKAFIVRVTTTDRTLAPDDLREKARKIAEQVAGILF